MPLDLVDYQVTRLSRTVNINDPTTYVLALPAVPVNYLWRVDQVSVAVFGAGATGFNPPTVLVYDQAIQPTTVPVQGTVLSTLQAPLLYRGTFVFWADFDDQGSPITVRGGDVFSLAYDQRLPNNSLIAARVQYGVFQGTSGQPTPVAGATPAPAIPPSI